MSNSNKVKLAIVGIGRMGMTHYSILNSHPNVSIIAIVDSTPFIVNLVKRLFIGIHAYTNYDEMLENEALDAVVICTPPKMHYEIVLKAGKRGIHVFSEKPFTTELKLAQELAEFFLKKGLVNQVGYVNRFNDVFKTVRNYIQQGVIGKVISFKSEMYSRTIASSDEGNTWRNSRENGGGAVFEVASHAIDLVNYIIGKPDKIIGSNLIQIYSTNVEDAVNSTFLYHNGISGTIDVNWSDDSYRKPINRIEILAINGKIIADQHELKLYLKKIVSNYNFHQGWNTQYITDLFKPVPFYVRGNEFTSQLYNFIDSIIGKEKNTICTFADAVKVHEVMKAIFVDNEQNGRI